MVVAVPYRDISSSTVSFSPLVSPFLSYTRCIRTRGVCTLRRDVYGVGEGVSLAAREHFRLFSRSVGINIYRLAASVSGEPPGDARPTCETAPVHLIPGRARCLGSLSSLFCQPLLLFHRYFAVPRRDLAVTMLLLVPENGFRFWSLL